MLTNHLAWGRLLLADADEKRGTFPQIGRPLDETLFVQTVSRDCIVANARMQTGRGWALLCWVLGINVISVE